MHLCRAASRRTVPVHWRRRGSGGRGMVCYYILSLVSSRSTYPRAAFIFLLFITSIYNATTKYVSVYCIERICVLHSIMLTDRAGGGGVRIIFCGWRFYTLLNCFPLTLQHHGLWRIISLFTFWTTSIFVISVYLCCIGGGGGGGGGCGVRSFSSLCTQQYTLWCSTKMS